MRLLAGDRDVEVDPAAPAGIDVHLTVDPPNAVGLLELDVALRGSPNASLWISGERISAFDPVPR